MYVFLRLTFVAFKCYSKVRDLKYIIILVGIVNIVLPSYTNLYMINDHIYLYISVINSFREKREDI